MAAEYDRIPVPPGSMATISNPDGEIIACGALLAEFTVSLDSKFGPLFNTGPHESFTVLGSALNEITSGRFGFSNSWKELGYSVWTGTEPITIQFDLEFCYTYDAFVEVVSPVRRLCKIPLPKEGGIGGTIIPPGPSVLAAIVGPSESNIPPRGDAPAPEDIDEDRIKNSAASYVNIRLGNMYFRGFVLTKAEPTFSKYVDEGNFPISARISIHAQSMYTATDESLDAIMNRC